MRRLSSHYTFFAPDNILRQAVVEQNEAGEVVCIFSLADQAAETSQTLFYDGIISGGLTSVSCSGSSYDPDAIRQNYFYLNLSDLPPLPDVAIKDKPLLLDPVSFSLTEVNAVLNQHHRFFSQYTVFEIIAALVYYPLQAVGEKPGLILHQSVTLLLWQGIDWNTKTFGAEGRILEL